MKHQRTHRIGNGVKADQRGDRPEDQGEDLVAEAIDLIIADATPLSPGQREALRRRLLGGGAQ